MPLDHVSREFVAREPRQVLVVNLLTGFAIRARFVRIQCQRLFV